MTLGIVSLFQKRGIFYKDWEVYSKDQYSEMETDALEPPITTKGDYDIPLKHEITPVDESGNTDYVTATFEDDGNGSYPYKVTVWLLVEEVPIGTLKKNDHQISIR